jgi:hypothetical protein
VSRILGFGKKIIAHLACLLARLPNVILNRQLSSMRKNRYEKKKYHDSLFSPSFTGLRGLAMGNGRAESP